MKLWAICMLTSTVHVEIAEAPAFDTVNIEAYAPSMWALHLVTS